MTRKKVTWTPAEDDMLRKTLATFQVQVLPNGHSVLDGCWSDIAAHLPGRTAKQCRERWCYNLCPTIKRDAWTVEEDAVLVETQRQLGNHWSLIARDVSGRTGDNVKIRFKSILRAARRIWSEEEDAKLLALFQFLGPNWKLIAEKLPFRTGNAARSRFHVLSSKDTSREKVAKELVVGAPEQLLLHPDYKHLVKHITELAHTINIKSLQRTQPSDLNTSIGRKRTSSEMASDKEDDSKSTSSSSSFGFPGKQRQQQAHIEQESVTDGERSQNGEEDDATRTKRLKVEIPASPFSGVMTVGAAKDATVGAFSATASPDSQVTTSCFPSPCAMPATNWTLNTAKSPWAPTPLLLNTTTRTTMNTNRAPPIPSLPALLRNPLLPAPSLLPRAPGLGFSTLMDSCLSTHQNALLQLQLLKQLQVHQNTPLI